MRHPFIALLALSYTPLIYAQHTLYDSEYGNLSAGLQIQTASLMEGNVRSGSKMGKNLSPIYGELTLEPNIKASIKLPEGSQIYAGFNYLYTSMIGHDPSGYTQHGVEMALEKSDFTQYGRYKDFKDAASTEEKYIGWKSGKLLLDENTIDLSAGAQDYKLGTGLLLANGTDDGGYRGSYWIGSRTAFTNTLIARINTNGIKLEGFHLETRPRDQSTKRNYDGFNIEYNYKDIANIGFSYINTNNKGHTHASHEFGSPINTGTIRINHDTYNVRANITPLPDSLPDLTISGEYVNQQNHTIEQNLLGESTPFYHLAHGGYGQINYKFSDISWKPTLNYRYTRLGKGFDSMAYGFKTWGSWFQGEINGEFILDNSNLITQLGQLTVTPTESVTLNLLYFNYQFVNPQAFNLTSAHYGNEIDLVTDWALTDTIDLAAGLETFIPSEGAKQYLEGNKTWVQGMVYASFKF